MTFIFYDTETTGLDAAFDQILQFAAIVTDDDLNPLEEINLRCRLQPHVIPSPGALVITGMRPSDIARSNLSHYEMIREIRSVIERNTPAVIVGYNSIGYDEGMLRQAFYQTLNPTYLTNTGGNTRMDVMRLAHAASEYAPDVIEVPLNDKGRPSFKLENLARANGLLHEDAHEAMSDTTATLELAGLVKRGAPELWQALHNTRSKQSTFSFLDETDVFCFTDKAFGQSSILATKIASNPNNSSEVAVFDLSLEPEHYLNADPERFPSMLKTSPRPVRIVKVNQQPILVPFELRNENVSGHRISIEELQKRVRKIKEHGTFAGNIANAVADRYPPWGEPEYVEQRIYEGFPSRADANLMEGFHSSPWEKRSEIISKFEDDRMKELGERLIFVERPDVLSEETRHRFNDWHRERFLTDEDVPWLTVKSAFDELEELKTLDDGRDSELLGEIELYLRRLDNVVVIISD